MLVVYLLLRDGCHWCVKFNKVNKARYLAYLRSFPNVYQVNIIKVENYDKEFLKKLPMFKHKCKPFNHITGQHIRNLQRNPGTPSIHVINIDQLRSDTPIFYSLTNCLLPMKDFILWMETVTLLAEQKSIEYKKPIDDSHYRYLIM